MSSLLLRQTVANTASPGGNVRLRPWRELWQWTAARFGHRAATAQTPGDPAREAARLRAMAWALPSTEGGFKADLLAAAERHERLHGVR